MKGSGLAGVGRQLGSHQEEHVAQDDFGGHDDRPDEHGDRGFGEQAAIVGRQTLQYTEKLRDQEVHAGNQGGDELSTCYARSMGMVAAV